MDNLTDYIRWMGEIPFSAYPLNESDALVLCMLSYFDFTPLFSNGETERPLRDSLRMIEDDCVQVMLVGRDRGFQAILEYAARSSRFGDLTLCDYVDLRRQEPPLQFAALCFHSPVFRFLAFRGTDASLAGWKEDFMISFTTTEAQQLAAKYALQLLADDGPVYIGGHSKGANLALYAACKLPEEAWEHVRRLYLLDGPGICPEVMDTGCIRRIEEKTTRILPAFSVIGRLFEPEISDCRIVQSSASGLVQHSLDTWGIDHGKLALAGDFNPMSRWLHALLDAWIGGISQENRAVFVEELFDALAADGADSLDDIETGGLGGYESILAKLLSSSAVTKKTIADLPKRAILGEYYDAVSRNGLGALLRQKLLDWQDDTKRDDGEQRGDENGWKQEKS